MKVTIGASVSALICLLFGAASQAAPSPSTAIVSRLTNQCWDVQDYSVADGAVIQLFACAGTPNQAWTFQVYSFSDGAPQARIVNVNSGMCAAVESSDPASGSIGLRQRPCNTNDPLQQFTVEKPTSTLTIGTNTFPIPLLARHIVSVATHWCLKADASFYRPFEAAGCGDTGDQTTRWQMVGI